MEFVRELGASAVLSSHLLGDIEQVCDHLVVLCDSRVQLAGDTRDLLATHARLVAPRGELDPLPTWVDVISRDHHGEHSSAVVHIGDTSRALPHQVRPVTLEELVLAHMTRAAARPAPTGAETWGTPR